MILTCYAAQRKGFKNGKCRPAVIFQPQKTAMKTMRSSGSSATAGPSSCGVPAPTVASATKLLEESVSLESAQIPIRLLRNLLSSSPAANRTRLGCRYLPARDTRWKTMKDIPANTEYRLGGTWKPGNYLVQINRSGVVTIQQVMKK